MKQSWNNLIESSQLETRFLETARCTNYFAKGLIENEWVTLYLSVTFSFPQTCHITTLSGIKKIKGHGSPASGLLQDNRSFSFL